MLLLAIEHFLKHNVDVTDKTDDPEEDRQNEEAQNDEGDQTAIHSLHDFVIPDSVFLAF